MALNYQNLDDKTRMLMVEEIAKAIENDYMYMGRSLTPRGRAIWPNLIRQAAQKHDDAWLEEQIIVRDLLNRGYYDRKSTWRKTPSDAAKKLAEGQFNHYYILGLCRRAINEGLELIWYRAKLVAVPRRASQEKIGTRCDPNATLKNADKFLTSANSGMSVKIVV